jgi:hypothetical protein
MSLFKNISLRAILPESKFVLKSFFPFYRYENGEKTDFIMGIKYEVIDIVSFETFYVKVHVTKPLIPLEDLQKPGSRYFVDFGNASVTFYVNNGHVAASVRADTIQLIDFDEEINL